MPISAMILSFNHPQKLWACTLSLLQQSPIQELLILENYSTVPMDEIYDKIRKEATQYPHVTVRIEKPSCALSYSEAQNYALDWAKHEFVLLMNNDAQIQTPDTIQSSISLMEKDSLVGIVGHKIVQQEGVLNHFGCYQTHSGFAHLGHGINPFRATVLCRVPLEMWAVTAAAILVRKTAIRFDPQYWFEYEDLDFCLQYRKAGYRILCNPDCVIYHEESSSRGVIQKKDPAWIKKQEVGWVHFNQKWSKRQLRELQKGLWIFNVALSWALPVGAIAGLNILAGVGAVGGFVCSLIIYGVGGILFKIGGMLVAFFGARWILSRVFPFLFLSILYLRNNFSTK